MLKIRCPCCGEMYTLWRFLGELRKCKKHSAVDEGAFFDEKIEFGAQKGGGRQNESITDRILR